jgi:hypothetical protein
MVLGGWWTTKIARELHKAKKEPSHRHRICSFTKFIVGFIFCILCSMSLSSQELDARHLLFQINANPNGVLLYNNKKIEQDKINSILFDKALVGYNPAVFGLDCDSLNFDDVAREMSVIPESSWVLCYKGQLLASGNELPTAGEVKNYLIKANVPSRVASLKAFLAQNPLNLDARLALMRELYKHAVERTARAMDAPNILTLPNK